MLSVRIFRSCVVGHECFYIYIYILKKWYLMPPCLTLSIIWYGSRVSGAIQGKGYAPPLHLYVLAIEKGAFGSPSTIYIYIYIYIRTELIIYIYIYIYIYVIPELTNV